MFVRAHEHVSLFVPEISPLGARALFVTAVGVGGAAVIVAMQVTEVYDKVKASLTYLRGIAEVRFLCILSYGRVGAGTCLSSILSKHRAYEAPINFLGSRPFWHPSALNRPRANSLYVM